MLLDKRKALYVKCCIIPNGITDTQGDTLYGEDIKKIFTSFNNQDNFEIYHEELPLQEVSLLENYISTADESIGNRIAPAGSWNATVRVDNPEVQDGLLTSEFGGVSLNNRIAPRCKGNLKGNIRYKDVADAECVIPLYISFVEGGANGFGLHVMDYDAFIKKSQDVEFENEDKNGGRIMDFKEFLNGLKSLIKEAEDTPNEEPAIEKEDKTKDEEVVETPTEEPVKDETAEEEPVVKKEDKATEEDEEKKESEEEPAIEKEDAADSEEPVNDESDIEARIAKLEEIVAKLVGEKETSEEEEESSEEPEEPEDEDTPKITKSAKVIIDDKTTPQPSNYYEMSGRDPDTGIKIRN